MKKFTNFLTGLCVCSLLTFTASAGSDSESKTVAPAPPPSCDWTGFYIGLNVGGAFGESDATDIEGYNTIGQRWSYDASGFVGGLELGYNFQLGQWLVLGLEGDVGYFGLDGSGVEPTSPNGDTVGHTDEGFYTTFRGRVGIPLFQNKLLPYVTGGGIGIDNEVGVFDRVGPSVGDGSSDEFRIGWTIGGGLAYALNCHWSVKAEYLYFDVDDERIIFREPGVADPSFFDTKTNGHIVRVGLDYRF